MTAAVATKGFRGSQAADTAVAAPPSRAADSGPAREQRLHGPRVDEHGDREHGDPDADRQPTGHGQAAGDDQDRQHEGDDRGREPDVEPRGTGHERREQLGEPERARRRC